MCLCWILDRGRISFIVLLLVNSNSSSLSYSGWSDHKRKYYLTILFFSGQDDWTDIGVEEVGQCWAGCVSLPFWNLPDQSAWEVGRDNDVVEDVIGGEGENSLRKQLLRNFKLTKICTAGSALFGNNTFPEEVSCLLIKTEKTSLSPRYVAILRTATTPPSKKRSKRPSRSSMLLNWSWRRHLSSLSSFSLDLGSYMWHNVQKSS